MPDNSIKDVSILENNDGKIRALIGTKVESHFYFLNGNTISIWTYEHGRFDFLIKGKDPIGSVSNQDIKGSDGRVFSSMPCKINNIIVRRGDKVHIGSPLCVTEAMKMEV